MEKPASKISGKTALITGGSEGIGFALAGIFASRGCRLILVGRDPEKLAKAASWLKSRYGTDVRVLAEDLSLEGAALRVFDQVSRIKADVDFLVNNAGFALYGFFESADLEIELEMIRLNIAALTALTKYFLKDMRSRGAGKILNVASTAAFQPGPWMAVYYATKAYVLSFSQAISEELRGSGVSVTALCPGPVRTGFQERSGQKDIFLFKLLGLMSPEAVARAGFEGMMKGKAVVIPGWWNQALALFVRLGSRRLVARIVYWLQTPTHSR